MKTPPGEGRGLSLFLVGMQRLWRPRSEVHSNERDDRTAVSRPSDNAFIERFNRKIQEEYTGSSCLVGKNLQSKILPHLTYPDRSPYDRGLPRGERAGYGCVAAQEGSNEKNGTIKTMKISEHSIWKKLPAESEIDQSSRDIIVRDYEPKSLKEAAEAATIVVRVAIELNMDRCLYLHVQHDRFDITIHATKGVNHQSYTNLIDAIDSSLSVLIEE